MDNTFCNQPWKYRVINISQDWYKFCCVSPEIKINNLSTIESDNTLNNVKNLLLANEKPAECNVCFNLEKNGVKSYRDIVADKNKDNLTPGLAVIEINLENTCNLRCAMCGPRYSSRWESKSIPIVSSNNLLDNLNHTIKTIEENKQSLQRIIISGGEPSIIPNFYRLAEVIKKSVPRNAWIYVNTNGMFNERLGNKFLDTIKNLSQTHNVLIYWSCDGKGEVGEFLRDGLDYAKFKENLKKLVEETTAYHTLQITTTHLNLKSQIELIEDVFTSIKPIPVKKLYPVIVPTGSVKQGYMHPNILGKTILKAVTFEDLKKLRSFVPDYANEFEELIKGISMKEPQIDKIKESFQWFKEYAISIEKEMPTELVLHFQKLGVL